MQNLYPIQINDSRFQVDHITPKKIQINEDYRGATNEARLFFLKTTRGEIEINSVGSKNTTKEVK